MAAWGAWYGTLGESVVDPGAPVGHAQTISGDGAVSQGAASNLSGYTIISADDRDGAVTKAKGCPILTTAGPWRSTRPSTWATWADRLRARSTMAVRLTAAVGGTRDRRLCDGAHHPGHSGGSCGHGSPPGGCDGRRDDGIGRTPRRTLRRRPTAGPRTATHPLFVAEGGHDARGAPRAHLVADGGAGRGRLGPMQGYPVAYGGRGDVGAGIAAFETLAFGDLSLLVKAGVQWGLFGGAIQTWAPSPTTRATCPAIVDLRLPGCFAMTETGHGSDVAGAADHRDLRPRGRQFIIHTPTRTRARTTSATPPATGAWRWCSPSCVTAGRGARGARAAGAPSATRTSSRARRHDR